jgi:hypothetical protein
MPQWNANPYRTFWLVLAIASTTLAVVLLCQMPPVQANPLAASASPSEPAPITAFSLQLGPGLEGIAVIDRQNYNICIYQYQPRKPAHQRFELVAARNFRYDLQLQQFNTEPSLDTVKQWLLRPTPPESAPPEDQKPQEPSPKKLTPNQSDADSTLTDTTTEVTEK